MKSSLRFLFCLLSFAFQAQDRIYFTDGTVLEGKVLEISTEKIRVSAAHGLSSFDRDKIAVLYFSNNTFEIITEPQKEIVHSQEGRESRAARPEFTLTSSSNVVFFNTLALVNAEITGGFERLLQDGTLGVGAFGSINFNSRANAILNSYIYPLYNAKKLGDAGLFFNFYSSPVFDPNERRILYFGLMVKYTPLKFTSIHETVVQTGSISTTQLSYSSGAGHQTSFLFSTGQLYWVTPAFYLRTLAAVGFFRLRGEYREQYNYMNNRLNPPSEKITSSILPKLYLAVYAEYHF